MYRKLFYKMISKYLHIWWSFNFFFSCFVRFIFDFHFLFSCVCFFSTFFLFVSLALHRSFYCLSTCTDLIFARFFQGFLEACCIWKPWECNVIKRRNLRACAKHVYGVSMWATGYRTNGNVFFDLQKAVVRNLIVFFFLLDRDRDAKESLFKEIYSQVF